MGADWSSQSDELVSESTLKKLHLEDAVWPKAVIPYEMDQSLAEKHELILSAMRHVGENSAYTFRSRTNETEFLKMSKSNGCSVVRGDKESPRKSLGMSCESFGSVLHELLYAIGFDLEHNRTDRDLHLDIYLYTMKEESQPLFLKRADLFVSDSERKHWKEECPFDYDSVMLYGSQTCSLHAGVDSMKAKDGGLLLEPRDKRGLSATDKKKLRLTSNYSLQVSRKETSSQNILQRILNEELK